MISNSKASTSGNGEIQNFPRYKGVATVSIIAINPNNETKRRHGFKIADDAPEREYVRTDKDGKKVATVSFLARIEDLQDKPVISLDFNWLYADPAFNKDRSKCEVIDSYGRTAWATKEDVTKHAIPQYSNGPAELNSNYKCCHRGESRLVKFWFKFLNMTPFSVLKNGVWTASKNPGEITIDHWDWIMNGNVTEMNEFLAAWPDNKVKVILGVRTDDENRAYQTFLCESGIGQKSTFFGNGIRVDAASGKYLAAEKAIAEFKEKYANTDFSAKPVELWTVTPSAVEETSTDSFGEETASVFDEDDLPFGD